MERLLSRQEAAALLGVPRRTLDEWAYRSAGPPFFKVGKYCRYRESDLVTWLQARRVEPSASNRSA